jgi:uncharacterized protein (TIGR03790 family)
LDRLSDDSRRVGKSVSFRVHVALTLSYLSWEQAVAGRRRSSAFRARFESLEIRELPAADLTAANVLVLYNPASSAGTQIAGYYAQVHPGVQLLAISGIDPNSETITADAYLATIRPQVLAALTSSTEVIVTTKGLPLRIQVTESEPTAPWPTLPTYTDPNGVLRTIFYWQPYSSLESELTCINAVSNWLMMGDQTARRNSYYLATGSFSHTAYGTYLTSRLDGYSTLDVKAAIDRAQDAFVGAPNSFSGPYFLVDDDPTKNYAPTMAKLANEVLIPAGQPVVYDDTTAFVSTAPGPIIGYDSHGVHQASTPPNYLTNGLNVTLAAGAIFNSWESYNAYSFTPGGYGGTQGQIAQWLAMGGTAGVGNVEEPGASTSRVANENQFFKMMLGGKTWAEAAWSSLLQLGFVNTVVGDPLMKWKPIPQATATIASTHLFYNDSRWDGYSADANAVDDAAIASDKSAYVPGSSTSTFASVSSYAKGINGLMVDISGSHGAITADDFVFRVGNNHSPQLWTVAPAPTSVVVRPGAGEGGSDRVEIVWPDYAISNAWLEVVVRGNDSLGGSNANTGLASSYVFFWGSAVGDSGADDASAFAVTSSDEISARANPKGIGDPATISNVNDFNRDGMVNSTDQIIARVGLTNLANQLRFLTVSSSSLTGTASVDLAPSSLSAASGSMDNAIYPATSGGGDLGIAVGLTAGSSAGSVVPQGGSLPALATDLQRIDAQRNATDASLEQFAATDSTFELAEATIDRAGEPGGVDEFLRSVSTDLAT